MGGEETHGAEAGAQSHRHGASFADRLVEVGRTMVLVTLPKALRMAGDAAAGDAATSLKSFTFGSTASTSSAIAAGSSMIGRVLRFDVRGVGA